MPAARAIVVYFTRAGRPNRLIVKVIPMSTISNGLRGIVQDGKVVFQSGHLPEGTPVVVTPVPAAAEKPAEQPSIWKKLAALAEEFQDRPCDLPPDLAANHDHYLHGLPKRT
jgi:hypothetical protein